MGFEQKPVSFKKTKKTKETSGLLFFEKKWVFLN